MDRGKGESERKKSDLSIVVSKAHHYFFAQVKIAGPKHSQYNWKYAEVDLDMPRQQPAVGIKDDSAEPAETHLNYDEAVFGA